MSDVWTIKRLLEWTTQFLAKKGVEKAGLDADLLLAHALGCSRTQLRIRFEEEAPEEARQRYRDLVRQRSEGCPVAYLVGRKEFYLLDFILSNPPYIPHDELAGLQREVRDFEPRLALDGGADGLAVFTRLVEQARPFLAPGGHLLVEIGSTQEKEARAVLEKFAEYEL